MSGDDGGTARRALRHRDFRLLLGALAVSSTGDWLFSVALIAYVFDATGSATWVAAVGMANLAPDLLLSTAAGTLADRFDRRRLMVACDALRAVLMLVLASIVAGGGHVMAVVVVAMLAATCGTPYRPASAALTPSLVPERDLAAGNAMAETLNNLALLTGPALGGVLLTVTSPAAAIVVNAATFVVAAACLLQIRTKTTPLKSGGGTLRAHMAAGLRAVVGRAETAVLVGMVGVTTLLYGAETVLWVVVADEQLGTGSNGVGYLLAAAGAGGLAGAAAVGRLAAARHPGRILTIAGVVLAASPVALGFSPSAPVAYGVLVVEGAAGIVVDVLVVTLLQRVVSGDVLGKVFGVLATTTAAATALGLGLASGVVSLAGLRPALMVSGVALLLFVVATQPVFRRIAQVADAQRARLAGTVSLLGRLPFLSGAAAPSLEALAQAADEVAVEAGATVIQQGAPADSFFVIEQGAFDVLHSPDGAKEPAVVNQLQAGDHFGEIGILEQMPRTASVVATAPSRLLRVSAEDFLAAVSHHPVGSAALRSTIAVRLARTHPAHVAATADTGG